MPNTVLKPQASIYGDRQKLLNSRLSERFRNSADREKEHQNIFDRLTKFEQKQLLKNIESDYSLILFDYFSSKATINRKIEEFAQKVFDINLPINKVVEIHLNVINSLEYQLLLEGLHTECLSDFRLTLIEVIAHLGELYRNALNTKLSDIDKAVNS